MNIGFDFDGVIADSSDLKIKLAKFLFNKTITPTECSLETTPLSKKEYKKIIDKLYGTDLFLNVKQNENSFDIINDLSVYNEVNIISKKNDLEAKIAKDWLFENRIEVNDFIFTSNQSKNKAIERLSIDYYIDDNFGDLEEINNSNVKLFLLENEINKSKGKYPLVNLKEFAKIILKENIKQIENKLKKEPTNEEFKEDLDWINYMYNITYEEGQNYKKIINRENPFHEGIGNLKKLENTIKNTTVGGLMQAVDDLKNFHDEKDYLQKADYYLKKDDFVNFEKTFDEAIEKEVANEDIFMTYLAELFKKTNNDKTENILDRAIEKFPNDARFIKLKSHFFFYKNDLNNAISFLERAIEIDPDSEAVSNLGKMHALNNNKERAKECYFQAMKMTPYCFDTLTNLGELELELFNNVEKAEKYYKKAIEMKPENFMAHFNLAKMFTFNNRFNEAKDKIIHLIKFSNKYRKSKVSIDALIGDYYLHINNFSKSKLRFEKVIKFESPQRGHAHNSLAIIYKSEKNIDNAEKHLRKAIEFDYNNSLYHFNLSSALLKKGNSVEALKEYLISMSFTKGSYSIKKPNDLFQKIIYSFGNSNSLKKELNYFLNNDNLNLISRLECASLLLPLSENKQQIYNEISKRVGESDEYEQILEKLNINSRNTIIHHFQNKLLDSTWIIKSGKNPELIEKEYLIGSFVKEELKKNKLENLSVEYLGKPIKKKGCVNLLIRTESDKKNKNFIEDALYSLAMIHKHVSTENKKINFKKFNYLSNIKRRFCDRFGESNNTYNFLNEYKKILSSQSFIDENYNSKIKYFLHTDAFVSNVLEGGLWTDWEPSKEGRIGDPLFDVSHFLSIPELKEKKEELLDYYLDILDEDYITTKTFNFNLFHNSIALMGSFYNQKNNPLTKYYFEQSLNMMDGDLRENFISVIENIN